MPSMETRAPIAPPRPVGLTSALDRNLSAVAERRRSERENAPRQVRFADAVSRFAGSMPFVYIHVVIFGLWVPINAGLIPAIPAWDPSFVILGTTASCEAIFLSTFVLISQNRMMALSDKRADLDLQIGLLSEHEVTKVIRIVAAIAERLGLDTEADGELDEVKQDVAPETVMDELDARSD